MHVTGRNEISVETAQAQTAGQDVTGLIIGVLGGITAVVCVAAVLVTLWLDRYMCIFFLVPLI